MTWDPMGLSQRMITSMINYVKYICIILIWFAPGYGLLAQEVLTLNRFTPEKKSHYDGIYEVSGIQNVDVIHYEIHIAIFPDSNYIEGKTSIEFIALEHIKDDLRFDISGLHIDSVVIGATKHDFSLQGEQIKIYLEEGGSKVPAEGTY